MDIYFKYCKYEYTSNEESKVLIFVVSFLLTCVKVLCYL